RVTAATGPSFPVRLVARHRLAVIDTQSCTFAYDLGFGEGDQRRMHAAGTALHARPGGERGEHAEGGDKFGPAVRIAARIQDVDTYKHVPPPEHLAPGERERQHDGVARRNISDRNAGGGCFGNRKPQVGEPRTAYAGDI